MCLAALGLSCGTWGSHSLTEDQTWAPGSQPLDDQESPYGVLLQIISSVCVKDFQQHLVCECMFNTLILTSIISTCISIISVEEFGMNFYSDWWLRW